MKTYDFTVFPEMATERLYLRKLESDDAQQIFAYKSNKNNFEFVDMAEYKTLAQAQGYIAKMNQGVDSNQWIIWAITHKSSKEIMGTISLWNINKKESRAELGFGLFQGNLGYGFMTEALIKVVEYGIHTMGLTTIEAYTNKLNTKSRALLEKNSFVKVSAFKESDTLNGEMMEMVVYKYLDEGD